MGAGSLMTPFLISGIGISPVLAVGTDLLFASITKASAAWRHHALGNVDWAIVRWLALGSLPGAAAMLAWIYLATPDTGALGMVIRKVLAVRPDRQRHRRGALSLVEALCDARARRRGADGRAPRPHARRSASSSACWWR